VATYGADLLAVFDDEAGKKTTGQCHLALPFSAKFAPTVLYCSSKPHCLAYTVASLSEACRDVWLWWPAAMCSCEIIPT
jgi:hypothetical protein